MTRKFNLWEFMSELPARETLKTLSDDQLKREFARLLRVGNNEWTDAQCRKDILNVARDIKVELQRRGITPSDDYYLLISKVRDDEQRADA